MPHSIRAALALACGAAVAVVGAWLGGIAVLLWTMGIPLGATPRESTAVEYGALLAVTALAAALGGLVAVRIAPARRAVVPLLGATLFLLAVWGFSGPGSRWPAWWGAVAGGVAAGGAAVAGMSASHRGAR